MREDIKMELVQAPTGAGKNQGELVAFKIDYDAPKPDSCAAGERQAGIVFYR